MQDGSLAVTRVNTASTSARDESDQKKKKT